MRTRWLGFGAVLLGLLALGGCAHLNYRAQAMPGDVWLTPPQVQTVAGEQASFRISFPGMKSSPRCELRGDGFAARAEANALVLTSPPQGGTEASLAAPATLVSSDALAQGATLGRQTPMQHVDALAALRSGLDRLQAAGCFPRADGDPLLRILQAVPFASADVSTLEGGNGAADGYFPLVAGDRLRVTTPLLDSAGNWKGATNLYYDLIARHDGELEVRPPSAAAIQIEQAGERLHAQLLSVPPRAVERLWSVVVFGRDHDLDQVNDLVGAPDMAAMRTATNAAQNRADGCAQMQASIICVAPAYGTVINIEVRVWVQGKWIGVRRGATVSDAIQARDAGASGAQRQGLRVLRPYGHKLIPVIEVPRNASALYDLVLLGGEHISWRGR